MLNCRLRTSVWVPVTNVIFDECAAQRLPVGASRRMPTDRGQRVVPPVAADDTIMTP